MPTMWTLVKWLPWQQQLERLGSSSGVGRGARVRLRWGETGGRRGYARPRAHLPPLLETPSPAGPQKPCSAQGQPHVVTGDTHSLRPNTFTHQCVTSRNPAPLDALCHQPTHFVTPWTGSDRHPVALADSHSSWELGCTQTRPPSGPRPPQRSCLGLAAREATGIQGLVLFAGNTGIYNALFLNLASPRLWLLWGGGGWNSALNLPCFRAARGLHGLWSPQCANMHRETEAQCGVGGVYGHVAPVADLSLLALGSRPRQGWDSAGAPRAQALSPTSPLCCLPGN